MTLHPKPPSDGAIVLLILATIILFAITLITSLRTTL